MPPVEVHMGFQVRLPGILHGGLEGENQHPFGPEFFGELIGGEGLAETHLGIPEEARNRFLVLCPDRLIVGVGFLDRIRLFPPHRKILVMRAGEFLATAQPGQNCPHVLHRAAHPFQPVLLMAFFGESCTDFMIGEN